MCLTRIIRKILRRLGYDIHRLPVANLTLRDLEFDLPFLVPRKPATIIDVGANKGQTIDLVQRALKDPIIISFEANPQVSKVLREKYAAAGVQVENSAVGSTHGTVEFGITENDELSSVLELSRTAGNPFAQTKTNLRVKVPVITLDKYCEEQKVQRIDLLKSDVQGYDLEVLKGAASLLAAKRIEVIIVEVNFIQLYENQCDFGQIERWLAAYAYRLYGFYEVVRDSHRINWATACFGK